eukprot:s248_g8.t1
MASAAGSQPFYKDEEIVVDRDGIPHFTGAVPSLMREYRQRVLFAFNNLEGDGKDEAKEQRDLQKKKQRFAKKLLDALHGEAFKACEELMSQHEKLREQDGYKHIFRSLQSIEKVSIVKKTEAFDKFFDGSHRKRGQAIDGYIRQRKQHWNELQDLAEEDLAEEVNMSEDLRAYFLLKHVGLSREDRRTVLLANQSKYTMEGIERALRTSFYDLHEKERQRDQSGLARGYGRKGGRSMRSYAVTSEDAASWTAISEETEGADYEDDGTEDAYAVGDDAEDRDDWETDGQEQSDYGASGDDDVFQAYAAMDQQRRSYRDSRKKLKDIQKARGFYKSDGGKGSGSQGREHAKQLERERSRCAACNRLGHWAGDAECPKTSRSGPKKSQKGKSKGGGKGRHGKAYMVGESPTFFSLGEELEEDEAYCNMVKSEDDETDMQQDSGYTETDSRRKAPKAKAAGTSVPRPWTPGESPMVPIPVQDLRVYYVDNFNDQIPKGLMEDQLRLRDLQAICDKWEVQTSGTKEQVRERLIKFFNGTPCVQKGYTKLYVQMKERTDAFSPTDLPLMPTRSKAKPKPKPAPAALTKAASAAGYPKASAVDRGRDVANQMMGNEDCRFFRPYTEQQLQETPKRDPKTNIKVPDELEVGVPCTSVPCAFCGTAMVLLRHWSDSSLYFECPDGGCKHFTSFTDGIQKLQAATASSSR